MRLLLDAHISPAVAARLRRDGVDAFALRDWRDGELRAASDAEVLAAALAEACVLVSYDCRTIPPLLKEWGEIGRAHAGVVLIDDKTVRPSDIGGIQRALAALAAQSGEEAWLDRVVFLRARDTPR